MDILDILPSYAERSAASPNLSNSGAPVRASTGDWRHSAAGRAGPLDDDDDDDEGDSWSKGGDDDDDEDEDDDLDDEDEDSADSVWAC